MRSLLALLVFICLGAAAAQTPSASTPGTGATSPLGTSSSPDTSAPTFSGIQLGATELNTPGISPLPCASASSNPAFDGGGTNVSSACGSGSSSSTSLGVSGASSAGSAPDGNVRVDSRLQYPPGGDGTWHSRRKSEHRSPLHVDDPLSLHVPSHSTKSWSHKRHLPCWRLLGASNKSHVMRLAPAVLTVLLAAAAGGLLFWHQSRAKPEAETPAQQQPTPVVAGKVKSGPMPI